MRRIAEQSPQQAEAVQARFADGFSGADAKQQAAALAFILDQPADALAALDAASDGWSASVEGIIFSELEEYDDAQTALAKAEEPAARIELVRVLIAKEELDEAEAAVDLFQKVPGMSSLLVWLKRRAVTPNAPSAASKQQSKATAPG